MEWVAMQWAVWGELTEEVLRRAGIGPGMHVLDIGCGAGDVAILAARLMGPSGRALGIDRSEAAVKRASQRAAAEGLSWSRFSLADVQAFDTDQRFDAIIGRLVLRHVADPARRRSLDEHSAPSPCTTFLDNFRLPFACLPKSAAVLREVSSWHSTASLWSRNDFPLLAYVCHDGDAAATGKDDPKPHLAMPALCDAEIGSALRVRNDILVPLVSMRWSNETA
jgi:SAM-dependent methyltransferase